MHTVQERRVILLCVLACHSPKCAHCIPIISRVFEEFDSLQYFKNLVCSWWVSVCFLVKNNNFRATPSWGIVICSGRVVVGCLKKEKKQEKERKKSTTTTTKKAHKTNEETTTTICLWIIHYVCFVCLSCTLVVFCSSKIILFQQQKFYAERIIA